jgi:hypothetical protein
MTVAPSHRTATRLHVGRLLDGTGTEPISDAAMLVIDGRIADVGSNATVAAPEDARVIDLPTIRWPRSMPKRTTTSSRAASRRRSGWFGPG